MLVRNFHFNHINCTRFLLMIVLVQKKKKKMNFIIVKQILTILRLHEMILIEKE